jgi:energy-coupling factor transport system permease protein
MGSRQALKSHRGDEVMSFADKIALGQYVPCESAVHSLDPRVKILSTLVLLFSLFGVKDPVFFAGWAVLLAGIVVLSRISFSMVLRSVRPVLWLLLFTVVLHVFFTPGEAIFTFHWIKVSREGLHMASLMGIRLLLLVAFAGLLTLTTSPMELADGMECLMSPFGRLGFPAHEMAMMMTIALRFIPTLLEETDRILKAQVSRGADLEGGGIVRRLRAFVPVLVPLFIIVFQRAEDLALAMESRCYVGGRGRTRMRPLRWRVRDTVALGAVVLSSLVSASERPHDRSGGPGGCPFGAGQRGCVLCWCGSYRPGGSCEGTGGTL